MPVRWRYGKFERVVHGDPEGTVFGTPIFGADSQASSWPAVFANVNRVL
jgi:hypothetical protein